MICMKMRRSPTKKKIMISPTRHHTLFALPTARNIRFFLDSKTIMTSIIPLVVSIIRNGDELCKYVHFTLTSRNTFSWDQVKITILCILVIFHELLFHIVVTRTEQQVSNGWRCPQDVHDHRGCDKKYCRF